MKAERFFLINVTDRIGRVERGWPLNSTPQTRKQCEAALRWQRQGGFDASDYRIAEISEAPGVFTYELEPGRNRPILFEQGPYTAKAFGEIHLQLWGN